MSNTVDLLAIGAHADDVDLTCGGTLVKAARTGHKTGIIDLTRGERGTRGDTEQRAREAAAAARVLGVTERLNAELPDAGLQNTDAARRTLVELIRQLRPTTVILPFHLGKHPDHRVAAECGRDACFLAGLAKYPADGDPHRPRKVIYAMAYREDTTKPTFVVDITDEFATKLEAVRCYSSQFDDVKAAGELFPTGQDFYDLIRTQDASCGSLIRTAYGEPFMTHETMRVDDVVALEVSTF